MIAYCLGHRKSYDLYLQTDKNPCKLGRRDDYEGGTVWLTLEEVNSYLSEAITNNISFSINNNPCSASEFSIYELELPGTYKECVEKAKIAYSTKIAYSLLKDAKLLKRIK